MAESAKQIKLDLSAVAYPEDDFWIAHCLELDIVAEGRTPTDAIKNMHSLCEFQAEAAIERGDLGSIFRQAPSEIMQMHALGKRMTTGVRVRPNRPVNKLTARKYAYA